MVASKDAMEEGMESGCLVHGAHVLKMETNMKENGFMNAKVLIQWKS